MLIGMACRNKVVRWLAVHFKTPADADVHYFGRSEESAVEVATESVQQLSLSAPATSSTGTQTTEQDIAKVIRELMKRLDEHEQLKTISEVFHAYVLVNHSVNIPEDFLGVASQAMAQLKRHNRSNVLYNLAKSMGTLQPDSDNPYFPMTRMPMGLVEYISDFFVSDEIRQVDEYVMFIGHM